MRDLGTKMAELKFEAPLAKFEETEDWGGCDFISNQNALNDTLNLNLKETAGKQDTNSKLRMLEEAVREANVSKNGGNGVIISPNCNTILSTADLELLGERDNNTNIGSVANINEAVDNFGETFGGSLEDLVNTFDERITKCFGNYEENVEELAPVQVRSQEEIMNECQILDLIKATDTLIYSDSWRDHIKGRIIRMWWTITGNFGNILPIDWSKSSTRRMHMPTLNLNQNKRQKQKSIDPQTPGDEITSEDEAIANDLDMHALILNGLNNDQDVQIKSVEEVIKEIDDIMDEAETPIDDAPERCENEAMEKAREVLGAPLYEEKLKFLSITQLNELYMEMEVLIQELSETLISELALRDEFEFEKELKNTFISLLLSVQNKRRQYHVEKKRGKFQGPEPKYLTTVIPYHLESGTPDNQSLQILIKILKAINEDSPTVPTLLTDYILKVLCPT